MNKKVVFGFSAAIVLGLSALGGPASAGGVFIDPNGGVAAAASPSDKGYGMDPNGAACAPSRDDVCQLDPNDLAAKQGSHIDPNGVWGWIMGLFGF